MKKGAIMEGNINIDKMQDEFSVIEMLESAVIDGFIESLSDNSIELDDEMLTSFVAVVFKNSRYIDFIKALGLAKFKDDREACLHINDFCAFLSDAREFGEKKLRE